jgi:hypothetical protein
LKGLFTNGRGAIALSAVALICAVGGGAYAASRSSGKITVCVSHAGGGLYKAKKCAKHDGSLSWNQAGIQGIQGKPGLQGPPGPGAKLISASAVTGTTTTGTIAGTWTYTLGCTQASPANQVDFRLTGPGLVALDGIDKAGVDVATGETPLADGYHRIFIGGPIVYRAVLQSGSTAVEVLLYVEGSSPCSLFGSAIPLSTS